jgi:Transposase DDE domain
MKRSRRLQKLQRPQSLLANLRQFLTPRVWKQARAAVPRHRAHPRWDLQPLVLIVLAMTWAAGDSLPEKFATARGFYVASYRARKRPGRTIQGFQKALARLPLRPLRALAAGVRAEIRRHYAERLLSDGFEPMGCDGSRIECPRTAELEARLGPAGKAESAPTVWVTAFVHLATGLLWSWQLGPGTADERAHLRHLLATLAPRALIVADAAYMGYELARAIVATRRSFLLRLSSKADLYTAQRAELTAWTEGPVFYWPKYVQEEGLPPIACRLIRIAARGRVKHDVWLLTDVLEPARLSVKTAAKFYRWRWRNEGVFRIYKRTISKLKLSSRTVRLVRREAELSLLATQLLLAHADLALRPERSAGEPAISPRKVLLTIRGELTGEAERKAGSYRRRLEDCRAEARQQDSPKASREWPRRQPHKPPGPPKIHALTDKQKAWIQNNLGLAV